MAYDQKKVAEAFVRLEHQSAAYRASLMNAVGVCGINAFVQHGFVLPDAANDNDVPTCSPKHHGSSISVVRECTGSCWVLITLTADDVKRLKLSRAQWVTIERIVNIVDPFFATQTEGYRVCPMRERVKGAVAVEPLGNGTIRVRKRMDNLGVSSSRPFYVPPVDYAPIGRSKSPVLLPFWERPMAFEHYKTLRTDSAGMDRRLWLSGWKTWGSTTDGAGDECYTCAHQFRWALKAAGRSSFDLDVCTMQENGRYSDGIQGIAAITAKWGQTPRRYRDIRSALAPVPAQRRFTSEGAFGSLNKNWDADLVWLNPPYSRRVWAVFAEKAAEEVAKGHAKIVVGLFPGDNSGSHLGVLHGPHACQILLSKKLVFYKQRHGTIAEIQNNQFVVFGRGTVMRLFLFNFTNILARDGYIAPETKRMIQQRYCFTIV